MKRTPSLFLMYRMELKEPFWEEAARPQDGLFLMYRMELKAVSAAKGRRRTARVPNVPYGVESWLVSGKVFLSAVIGKVPNVPYGVESAPFPVPVRAFKPCCS